MYIAIIIITTEKLSSGIISSPWNVIFKKCLVPMQRSVSQ